MCSVRGCSALALALGKPCGCLSRPSRRDEEAEATEDDAARMVESMVEAAHAGCNHFVIGDCRETMLKVRGFSISVILL